MRGSGCGCGRGVPGGAPLPAFYASPLGFSGFEGADGLAVCSGFAADGVFDPGG